MPSLDDVFNSEQQPDPINNKVIVDGSFSCQECYTVCDEAEYVKEKQIIFWKCPSGHVSSTGFRL